MNNTDSGKTKSDYFTTSDGKLLDEFADGLNGTLPVNKWKPEVVITIPAHNEEKLIARCIEALAHQRTCQGDVLDRRTYEILIFCHNCTDDTRNRSLTTLSKFPDLNLTVLESDRPEINNVGAVRRVLMRIAGKRVAGPLGYIAMTDADSVADSRWVDNIIKFIDSGYGLICGRIQVDTENLTEDKVTILAVKQRYEELRNTIIRSVIDIAYDAMPTHCDNSGPNMAVRADVYEEVGGIEPLGYCEDVAFYDKIIWGGYRVRHCPKTIVVTSGRTATRVPWGFGAELGTWGEAPGLRPMVEGLEGLLERLRIYKLTIKFAESGDKHFLISAARRSGIEVSYLKNQVGKYNNVRALVHQLEKDLDASDSWRNRFPKMDICDACHELEVYVSLSPDRFSQMSIL